jgi:hypothetical protein
LEPMGFGRPILDRSAATGLVADWTMKVDMKMGTNTNMALRMDMNTVAGARPPATSSRSSLSSTGRALPPLLGRGGTTKASEGTTATVYTAEDKDKKEAKESLMRKS